MVIKSKLRNSYFKIDHKQHEYLKKLFILIGLSSDCLTKSTKSHASTQIGTMISYHLENESIMETIHGSEYVVCIKPVGISLPDSFQQIRREIALWLSKLSKFLIDSCGFDLVEESNPIY